jgi:hypothetical protein
MPNIARATPRNMPVRAGVPAPKTKILLVRQPVKSVRKSDEPNRDALHLAYGVVIALGVLAALWLLGYLGFRMGFAPTVRVPDLLVEGAGGLAAGAMMLISLPQTILVSGMEQPMALMLGFALIAIPAAILGAVKPVSPGGPKPKPEIVALSIIGAIAAALNAGAVVWWATSPLRGAFIHELPMDPVDARSWITNLQIAGGLDALATIAAALWVVVIMRLAIPTWLRALSASACFFGLAVIAVAMAMSNVTISQSTSGRAVFFLDEGSIETRLLLGHTPRSMATLGVAGKAVLVELRDRPAEFTVVGQEPIVDYVANLAPPQE